jgi:glycosyltransferase involved in cell wall biosynthesis
MTRLPAVPATITGCILARNEEAQLDGALRCLQGWTDQLLVLDHESTDATAEIARRSTPHVIPVSAPRGTACFDGLRNHAIEHATGDWIFFLDADERVPEALGRQLRQLVQERGAEFEALIIPFKNYFCGKWMEHSGWWPGYTRPQLLKKGRFYYNERLHSGVRVDGRTLYFPPDPALAIDHYSYTDLHQYLAKLNRYTDGEAESLRQDGQLHTWQAMLAHFTLDWQGYYERGRADQDGMHGFVLAFMSAFYRFASRAKLWDQRRLLGELRGPDPVPADLREMLEFMAQVVQHGPGDWLQPGHHPALAPEAPPSGSVPSPATSTPQPLLWHAPLHDASGYADEARAFVLGLIEAGEPVALAPARWEGDAGLDPETLRAFDERTVSADTPCELYVCQTLIPLMRPHPHARVSIGRTMFETDRLPEAWVPLLNRMDRLWVPSEFNRESFARCGVDPDKLAIVPEALDAERFSADGEPWPVPGAPGSYRFLSVFDWSHHKGWDVLLDAFTAEFGDEPSVELVLKTWSSNGYSLAQIRDQAEAWLRQRRGRGLDDYPNLHLWKEAIPAAELSRLYRAVHAFVLPTRGEGWCRPLMEAMASGLPTIATAWSGLTAFHDAQVGYPLKYQVRPVTEAGAREIPVYAGHCWAEPDTEHLRTLLRTLVAEPGEAARRGQAARDRVCATYSRAAVAERVREELAHCRTLARSPSRPAPAMASVPSSVRGGPPADRAPHGRTLLLQAARGSHREMLELTRDRHAAYARTHGMEYACRLEYPAPDRHAGWDKIALLLDALRSRQYETIVWLDADALIVDERRDLREALPAGLWLGMARHGEGGWYNSGAMYLRATPECLQFFEAVWANWPVGHPWEDNAAILQVLEREPGRWPGVGTIDDAWNSTFLVNESPQPVVMAWHGLYDAPVRALRMREALTAIDRYRAARPGGAVTHATVAEAVPGLRPQPKVPVFVPAADRLQTAPPTEVDLAAPLGRPLRVRWEGDQSILSSLALLNREYCLGLLERPDVELTLRWRDMPWPQLSERDDPRFGPLFARREAPLSGPPDVVLRHHFPPNWQRPEAGKLIVMQPWEYGHLPCDWVKGARQAEEIWVYTRFVRDIFVRSGVPADRVKLVPPGVDPGLFSPEGPAYPLETGAQTRFLFVGGALDRKGADLLLDAYLQAFTAADDVCLVVKDMGTRTFYVQQTFGERFRRAQADPNAPQILYLEDDLPPEQLAALYRSCTCVVMPYRGEGFCLPPLEGMACGVPALLTGGGPTDDFHDETMGLRLPARRKSAGRTRVGDHFECVGDPWQLEPDFGALVQALRWAHAHPQELAARGKHAAEHARTEWSWARATGCVRQRLHALAAPAAGAARVPARALVAPETEPAAGRSGTVPPSVSPVLSLCMIVRDEAARLRACLESIRPHVDEMVVVDTGSKDRTREVAVECGARVFEMPWPDDFAAARNESLRHARGQWIFWMDADDVISSECGRQLRELIARHPQRDAAYQVQVRIPPGPGEFSEGLVDHVKLFPNRPELRFEHRIHEQILPSLRQAGIEVHPSELFVTHRNYDRSAAGQAKKRQRDFRLLELDLRDRPEHPFVLFNLGMTHLYATKEYEVAAQYLRRSLDRSDWKDSIVRKAYAMLATARICQLEWQAAVQVNEEGRGYYPDDAELLFQAGQIYQQLGRFDDARRAFERLIAGQEGEHYRSVDVGLRTYRGRHELALLHARMGDLSHAAAVLEEIAAAHPAYFPAHQDLVGIWSAVGKAEAARCLAATFPAWAAQGAAPPRAGANGHAGPNGKNGGSAAAPGAFPEPDWDRAPQFGDRASLLGALRRLHTLRPGAPRILQIGTIRDATPAGAWVDGWSTVAWAWYAAETGGRVWTVDLRREDLDVCQRVVSRYGHAVEPVCADPAEFLKAWNAAASGTIDLLHLHRPAPAPGGDGVSAEDARQRVAEAALPHLSPACLVLVGVSRAPEGPGDRDRPPADDSVVRYFLDHGFQVERTEGDSILLSRGVPAAATAAGRATPAVAAPPASGRGATG